jgi:hypothetical protein
MLSVTSGIFALLNPAGHCVVGRASPSFAIAQALLSAAISVLLVLTAMPEWLDLITRNRHGPRTERVGESHSAAGNALDRA